MASCRSVIAGVPCAHCPFRKDVPIYLRPERRAEIADVLAGGGDFPCHATVSYDEDEDGEAVADTTGSQTCAGAAKAVMASGGTTQLMRIAQRLGMADLDRIAARGAEVWTLDEWRRLAEGSTGDDPEWIEDDDVETCNTCDPGCLAPAGWLGAAGTVVRGTKAANGTCSLCGEGLCSKCADKDGRCGDCRAWDDEDEDEEDEGHGVEEELNDDEESLAAWELLGAGVPQAV